MESAKRRGVKLVRSLSGKTPALNELDTLVEQVDAGAGAIPGTLGGGGGAAGGGLLKRRSSGGIRADDKDVKDLLFEGVEPLSAVDATHVVLTGKDTYLQVVRSPLSLLCFAGFCSYSVVLRDVTLSIHLSYLSPAHTVASSCSHGMQRRLVRYLDTDICYHGMRLAHPSVSMYMIGRSVCLSIHLSVFLSFCLSIYSICVHM